MERSQGKASPGRGTDESIEPFKPQPLQKFCCTSHKSRTICQTFESLPRTYISFRLASALSSRSPAPSPLLLIVIFIFILIQKLFFSFFVGTSPTFPRDFKHSSEQPFVSAIEDSYFVLLVLAPRILHTSHNSVPYDKNFMYYESGTKARSNSAIQPAATSHQPPSHALALKAIRTAANRTMQ